MGNADLGMGNEMAINQLIAHHSVIFQPQKRLMWVSTSPWQCGRYVAYDLNKIFSDSIDFHQEIATQALTIPEDPFLRQAAFGQLQVYKSLTPVIRQKTARRETVEETVLQSYEASNPSLYYVYEVLGDYYQAIGETQKAVTYWKTALTKPIPKQGEKERIQTKIQKQL